MKKLIAVLLLSSAAFAQSGAKPPSPAEKEVLDVETKYNGAYAANDLPAYFGYLAPDFVQWLPGGRSTKDQYQTSWTKFITAGNKVLSADFTDMQIQVSPSQDAAAASYLLHVVTHSTRGDSDEYFQESDVLFKRDGVWKVVHLNYAPARKKKPAATTPPAAAAPTP
jgi:ketosteroid isomerase-like protein